jgi:predicted phage terminase large subunit-like protein
MDKVTRMSVRSPAIEAGQFHLPASAPWLADFEAELLSFPNGRFDDQVDTVSQLLNWLHHHISSMPLQGRYHCS